MAACSLGGATNMTLFTCHSEATKIRYSGIVTPPKATFRRLESRYRLKGNFPSHGPVHAAENDLDAFVEESNRDPITPVSPEVESLLTTICDTTSIAEFELKLSGFRLYVKRDLVEEKMPYAPSLPTIRTTTSNQTPESNGSATSSISKPKTSSVGIQRILDTAPDEGLVILQSPRVGFFRRSRTIKGKRAPPSCKEKQRVKEGQVLCYIEQLGGEIPIESDVSGEVIKILREDGEAVGYGDLLISLLPSFPGIKKL